MQRANAMNHVRRAVIGLAVGLAIPHAAPAAASETVRTVLPGPQAPAASEPPLTDVPEQLTQPGAPETNALEYCRNISDAAADVRFALQAKALGEMEKELEERIAALEAKRAEYEEWLARREEFAKKADESVVAIYSQMRPDAAAQQIGIMDPLAAAAILSKLSPRTASAILNEMDPNTAAMLTGTIAGLAQKPTPKEQQG